MKHNLLSIWIIVMIQGSVMGQSSYYWSIDKKIPVDLNYQIVSVPYEGTADIRATASKFGFKESDVKEVSRAHNKINRIDFTNALSVASLSDEAKKQIIPSMNIGKQAIPIFLTGEITIQPNGSTRIDEIVKKYGLTLIKKLEYGPYLMKVPEPSKTLEIANKIHESELVEWASPDLLTKTITFNDPLYTDQYYLKNTGQLGGTAGIDIKAEDAWGITKGCYIRVAVLDEGIDGHDEWNNGRFLGGLTAGSLNTGGAP
ncbi:hypothetical protein [Dyadobacter sp. 3J3]|uniref:hypothetical protein n=1 Tax=Dyadobacter sp. 3J3 TaxID=2606600 RepID=UPI00135CC89C|nr:hypothetical protein [Dyadobacter sp. 3J3]